MSASTGLVRIVIEDGPSQPSRTPPPNQAGQPQFSSPSQPSSPAPAGPPPFRAQSVSADQMTRAILSDPGMKKLGMTPETLGKMPKDVVAGLYDEVAKSNAVKADPRKRDEEAREERTPQPVKMAGFDSQEITKLTDAVRGLTTRIDRVGVPMAEKASPKSSRSEADGTKRENVPQPVKMAESEGQGRLTEAVRGLSSKIDRASVPKPAPKPRQITYDDFATATPRPRAVTAEDFGFRPVGRPVPRAPAAEAVATRSSLIPKAVEQFLPRGVAQAVGAVEGYFLKPKPVAAAAAGEAGAVRAGAAAGGAAAGGGSAVAGRMAAAGAAAGPAIAIAAAALIADKVAGAIAGTVNMASQTIAGVGKTVERMAANDHMEVFNAAVDGASAALGKIPIVGQIFSSALQLAVAPVRAMAGAAAAFVARGKELSGFSGALAGANANADVRSLLGDIREAQVMGASIARTTDASSRIDNGLRELLLPIKEGISRILGFLLDKVAYGVEMLVTVRDIIGEGIIKVLEGMKALVPRGAIDRALAALIAEIRILLGPIATPDPMASLLAAGDPLFGIGPIPGMPLGAPGAAPFGS